MNEQEKKNKWENIYPPKSEKWTDGWYIFKFFKQKKEDFTLYIPFYVVDGLIYSEIYAYVETVENARRTNTGYVYKIET
ncbi:hypothetical protein COV24_03585 [candidate division WWE3 bacterium CG10_big_fil_rev_8_21_14_0_10_32_10]|uniref:Uncharacterized protein n=1 Tax=candidate division WWE3 bacterium CG10_big_fil_rev_8_21_14_0_10_32_10 TaxID=1975090 RepID=A0A2H0R9V1_UNCKA|nr:MAG: hypothetical protein COV24_03585 [candidate division WWE3 bacterium CG10_big_fil_rev_8_21_14_0_10_32_10]